MKILDNAVQTYGTFSYNGKTIRWTMYLSDAGGQPEFQEMLPALASGPSIYFLTIPLHIGLNTRFRVEYEHPNGESIIPFQASMTIKEAILSSVASITSTQSYTKVENGQDIDPKILVLATHRDKLESREQLLQIDKELQEALKMTAAYQQNMIEFKSETQMVFDLDNTSRNEEDIQSVRDAVERIGTCTNDYHVQTPYTWMILAVTLRNLPGRVLSITECAEVGKACGIERRKELSDALWFLHHNVGIIRHFQEVPDLEDVVIKEPQYIFDKVTEMIVYTFTFEAVGAFIREEFLKKGIIPVDTFQKISLESDVLTHDKFAILMEHLNIITPIEENGKVTKYFAPCALAHADLPPDAQSAAVNTQLTSLPECEIPPPPHVQSESDSIVNPFKVQSSSKLPLPKQSQLTSLPECEIPPPPDAYSESDTIVKLLTVQSPSRLPLPTQSQANEIIPSSSQVLSEWLSDVPNVPPLFITFKSGYCPKGIFGSLIVKLLKKDKQSSFKWELNEDRIYWDQICLSIGPYDSFRFSLRPTYIKLSLISTNTGIRKIPLGRVCCDVRREIEISICSVTESLHYTQRASHSLAFACPHNQLHAAEIKFSPEGEPCTIACPLTSSPCYLPFGYDYWFNEVCKINYSFITHPLLLILVYTKQESDKDSNHGDIQTRNAYKSQTKPDKWISGKKYFYAH